MIQLKIKQLHLNQENIYSRLLNIPKETVSGKAKLLGAVWIEKRGIPGSSYCFAQLESPKTIMVQS